MEPKTKDNSGIHDLMTGDNAGGDDTDYYLLDIPDPKRVKPHQVECEDIIEALDMRFAEGNIFKALWRKCAERLGSGKEGDSPIRNADKIAYYGNRVKAIEHRKEVSIK